MLLMVPAGTDLTIPGYFDCVVNRTIEECVEEWRTDGPYNPDGRSFDFYSIGEHPQRVRVTLGESLPVL